MNDKVYTKQLEKFGIEAIRVSQSDAEKQREKHNEKEHRLAIDKVIKREMETMEGRQYFWSKLDMCRVFTTPFVPGAPDGTAFFSGIQSVGQNLLDDIMRASPDNFYVMIQEANARAISGRESAEN